MIEQLKYRNHLNEEIEWGKNGIYVNYNDLRDFSWDFHSHSNRITSFFKGIVVKTVPLIIKCQSQEEGIEKRNKLFEICEKDVLAVKHGKIIIGDYYLKCYITGSQKSKYLMNKGYMEVTLTVSTDGAFWTKEVKESFWTIDRDKDVPEKRNLDFNYDFPFDYTSEFHHRNIINSGFVGTPFKMIIYGPCSEPEIHIGGNTYQVFADLTESEYLTIDSIEKKIVLTRYNGEQVNCFHLRNRESYIFEPIPPGENIVNWNGLFGFDLITYDERSEPKWI